MVAALLDEGVGGVERRVDNVGVERLAIGDGVPGRGAGEGLEVVGEAVAVGILVAVGGGGIESEGDFEPVGDAVAVAVAGERGEFSGVGGNGADGGGVEGVAFDGGGAAIASGGGGAELAAGQVEQLAVGQAIAAEAEERRAGGQVAVAVLCVDASIGDDLAGECGDGVAAGDESLLEVQHRGRRELGLQQGDDARRDGRGHRGAGATEVGAVRIGGEDAVTRRGDVDAGRAVAAERGQVVLGCGGRDGDDVVEVIAGGIDGKRSVVVVGLVAGGADEEVTGRESLAAGVVEGIVVGVAAPGVAADGGTVADGVADGGRTVGGQNAAVTGDLDAHDADVPVDAGDACAVVADGADVAGAVRAVSGLGGVVHGIAVE